MWITDSLLWRLTNHVVPQISSNLNLAMSVTRSLNYRLEREFGRDGFLLSTFWGGGGHPKGTGVLSLGGGGLCVYLYVQLIRTKRGLLATLYQTKLFAFKPKVFKFE